MPNAKEGYPDKLSSKEIKEEINSLRRFANGGGYKPEYIIAANAMIQSGLTELNDRFGRKTFWMMFILTILSVIAALVSIYYSLRTDKSDLEWRNSEIILLQNINQNLKNDVPKLH